VGGDKGGGAGNRGDGGGSERIGRGRGLPGGGEEREGTAGEGKMERVGKTREMGRDEGNERRGGEGGKAGKR